MVSFSKNTYANTTYSGADIMATITIKNTDKHKNALYVLGELQTLSYSTHMNRGAVRNLGNINVIDFTNGPRTIAGSLVFAVFNRHLIRPIIEQMGVNREMLPDELPPFDITITYANEYGHNSVMRIYGVRLVNEGQVCSVNDIYTENTYQYVAQNIELLETSDFKNINPLRSEKDYQAQNFNYEMQNVLLPATSNQEIKIDTSKIIIKSIINQVAVLDTEPHLEKSKLYIESPSYKKSFLIHDDQWPHSLKLAPDEYNAILKDNDDKIIHTTSFRVDNISLDPPLITKVTTNSISGKVSDNRVQQIVCSSDKNTFTAPVIGNIFSFNDLAENTIYRIYVKDHKNNMSQPIRVQTLLENKNDNMYEQFLAFVNTNQLDDLPLIEFINEAKKGDSDFLHNCYTVFNPPSGIASKAFSESYMHLAAYFDLCYQQNKNNFIYDNKWLSAVSQNPKASDYKIFSNNGVATDFGGQKEIIVLQQHFENQIQKMSMYKPSTLWASYLQQDYLKSSSIQKSLKERFNVRNGQLPINRTTGYYDSFLSSKGSYIEIDNNVLIAHTTETFGYFAFKDDLNIDIAFKVPIPKDKKINFKTLPFYNPEKTYLVYLESQQYKSISKSIIIVRNQATYSYDSLLSLSLEYKMQNFIQEITCYEHSLFEVFCNGFYLAIQRKMNLQEYINLFDRLFYTDTKKIALSFNVNDDSILCDTVTCYAIFDLKGHLKEYGAGLEIKRYAEGHCILSTDTHIVKYINFSNI